MDAYYTDGDLQPGLNGYVQIPLPPGYYEYLHSPPYSHCPCQPGLPFAPFVYALPRMDMFCSDQYAGEMGCSPVPFPEEWKAPRLRKTRKAKWSVNLSAAFNLFQQENYQNVLQMHPHLCRNDIANVLHQIWLELSEQDKLPYYCRTGMIQQQQQALPPNTSFQTVGYQVPNAKSPQNDQPEQNFATVNDEFNPWPVALMMTNKPVAPQGAEGKETFITDTLPIIPDDLLAQALNESGIREETCFSDITVSPISPSALDTVYNSGRGETIETNPQDSAALPPSQNGQGGDFSTLYQNHAGTYQDGSNPVELTPQDSSSLAQYTYAAPDTTSSETTTTQSEPGTTQKTNAENMGNQVDTSSQALSELTGLLFDGQKDVLTDACELSTLLQDEMSYQSTVAEDWIVDSFNPNAKPEDPYYT